MTDRNVPRRVELLLQSLGADDEFQNDVLGDLAEEYGVRVQWDGRSAARRWYYRESLRLVPYLLRDAGRRLTLRDAGRTVAVMSWSSLVVMAFDKFMLRLIYKSVFLVTGIPFNAYLHHWETTSDIPATQILWLGVTLLCGLVGGAATVSFTKRPRLSDTVVTTGLWAGMMIFTGMGIVPPVFSALNTAMLIGSTIAGGLAGVLLRARKSIGARIA